MKKDQIIKRILVEEQILKNAPNPLLIIADVSGSFCPKCGCDDYEEWEELEYEKGGDDPMYGGALVPMKFTRWGECN